MKTRILILSAATWWLQGTWAQRIPVNNNPTADAISSLDESSITEQIAINRTDANPSPLDPEPSSDGEQQEEEEPVPISVVLFDGPPGPKENCRGNAILRIGLTKPGTDHTTPTCYNVSSSSSSSSSSSRIAVAQCGNFLANKDDGCEAKVFSEPGCREFSNVAVFVPEVKAFGGYMLSLEVACGIVGVVPAPLKLPGLELPPGAVQAVG
ncbi:hypothetical protein F5Y08DRAFT_113504 [Xylaria arbuscula]|nr:hypothetical protein F5Y08DRAFT_113504 [Xylaria arbuscula]